MRLFTRILVKLGTLLALALTILTLWLVGFEDAGIHYRDYPRVVGEGRRLVYTDNGPARWSAIDLRVRGFRFNVSTPWNPFGIPTAPPKQTYTVEVSILYFLLFTLLGGLLWWRDILRKRRHALLVSTLHCAKCGYDLRATPDRCPECGAEPARAGPAKDRPA